MDGAPPIDLYIERIRVHTCTHTQQQANYSLERLSLISGESARGPNFGPLNSKIEDEGTRVQREYKYYLRTG